MRTFNSLMISLMLFLLISCQKNEFNPGPETGSLCLNIGLSIRVNEINSPLKSVPLVEDFAVTVYRTDGSEAISFASVAVMPDTIELEIGNYYVEAHSDNMLPAAFENP